VKLPKVGSIAIVPVPVRGRAQQTRKIFENLFQTGQSLQNLLGPVDWDLKLIVRSRPKITSENQPKCIFNTKITSENQP
jgi:hypothetical protein